MDRPVPLMTLLGYARHRGVSKSYIRELVEAGTLPAVLDKTLDASGKEARRIQSSVADKILDAKKMAGMSGLQRYHAEQRKKKAVRLAEEAARLAKATETDIPPLPGEQTRVPFAQPSDESYVQTAITASESRAKKESYAAKTAEVEYRKMVGELVERAAVEQAIGQCALLTRTFLERLPDRVSERVAAALGVDPAQAHPLLVTEVNTLCSEIAAQIASLPTRLSRAAPTPTEEPDE